MSGHWDGAVAEWAGSASDCTQSLHVVLTVDELDDQSSTIETWSSNQITAVGRPTRELPTAVAA